MMADIRVTFRVPFISSKTKYSLNVTEYHWAGKEIFADIRRHEDGRADCTAFDPQGPQNLF
jgi:hypothetical protein